MYSSDSPLALVTAELRGLLRYMQLMPLPGTIGAQILQTLMSRILLRNGKQLVIFLSDLHLT
jgi:hypothetical protein